MSHKQKCIDNAQDYLMSRGLAEYWSLTLFNSYYRKHDGANGNAYITGLDAADFIIHNALNTPEYVATTTGQTAAA